MTKFLCLELADLAFDIRLEQTGLDRFAVTYGKQHKDGLSYAAAASELGACIMHALACEGQLDNRTAAEARADGDRKPYHAAEHGSRLAERTIEPTPDGPYRPELAEAFRTGARELCNCDLGDRIHVDADARVEEGEGGAQVHCVLFVSDAERTALAGEEAEADTCPHCGEEQPAGPATTGTWTCAGCNALIEIAATVEQPATPQPPAEQAASGTIELEHGARFRWNVTGSTVPEIYGWLETAAGAPIGSGGFWRTPDAEEAARRAKTIFAAELEQLAA